LEFNADCSKSVSQIAKLFPGNLSKLEVNWLFFKKFIGIKLARDFPKPNQLMPQGDKSSYTGKQKRQAEHIEEGYEKRGLGAKESGRRAWATVNKVSGGGKKSGSGVGKKENHAPMRKGGRLGGKAKGQKK
jgi:hypothetical protein